MVYISQTVILRGGYTTTNWTTPYPITQPTTLDAQRQGRALYITGNINPTVEGLHITGGNAAGLGGSPSGDSGGGVLPIYLPVILKTAAGNPISAQEVAQWHQANGADFPAPHCQ